MEIKNYKYDATIFLPIHVANKPRVELFNEIGIVNCKKSKILLCFLTGSELYSQKEIEEIYPKYAENENIDLKYLRYESDHPAAKVYDFYLQNKLWEDSKWIIKIDDDTSTDIDMLMNFLLSHNEEKEYVFISHWSYGDVEITKNLLDEFEIYEKIEHCKSDSNSKVEALQCKRENLDHEHEILICSNLVMNIVTHKYKEIIKRRSEINDGYTDQLFYNLCKAEKIYGIQTRLLDSDGDLLKYLSNLTFHTHNLSPERDERLFEKVALIKQKEKDSESSLNNREYLLTMKFSNEKEITDTFTNPLKLGSRGDIIGENIPFKFWREKDGKLQFLDDRFKISVEYELDNEEFIKQIPRKVERHGEKVLSESYLIMQSTTPND